jgi:hypothetical protein
MQEHLVGIFSGVSKIPGCERKREAEEKTH